jgi:glutaredoxin 3
MYTIYSKPNCTYCKQAKALLDSLNLDYVEIELDVGQEKLPTGTYVPVSTLLELVPGAKTVPQIFDNDHHIGGFKELKTYLD